MPAPSVAKDKAAELEVKLPVLPFLIMFPLCFTRRVIFDTPTALKSTVRPDAETFLRPEIAGPLAQFGVAIVKFEALTAEVQLPPSISRE